MEQTGRLFSTKGYMIDNEPQDISGGYLLELEMSDRYGVEASGFITSRMQPVVFTSQYIYKPKDGISTRFYAGPAWDYDKAIAGSGITQEGIDLHEAEGLYAAVQTRDSDIWYALYQHADFRQCVADIYT